MEEGYKNILKSVETDEHWREIAEKYLLLVLEEENAEKRVELILALAVSLESRDNEMCLEVYALAVKEAGTQSKALESLLEYFKRTKRYGKAFMIEQRLEKLVAKVPAQAHQSFATPEETREIIKDKTMVLGSSQDKTHMVPPPPTVKAKP